MIEVDANGRLVARTVFDVEDVDAAFADLETRYVAGEASEHADSWWRMVEGCARLNRHQAPLTTANFVDADHRAGANHAPGDMKAFVSESWGDTPDIRMHMEAVHALADSAVVVTTVLTGTSTQGFEAEWRSIGVVAFDGALSARTELFDESALDSALVLFSEITGSAGRLENSATRTAAHLRAAFARRDWSVIEGLFSVEVVGKDRRDVIGGSRLVGRGAEVANLQTMADLGATRIDSSTLAIRGDRLALHRTSVSGDGNDAEVELLTLFEAGADGRITANLHFDAHDYQGAFAELDDRYIAGLAEEPARAYATIARGFAEIAQGRIPAVTADFADADHRRVAGFEDGGLTDYLRAGFGDMAHSRMYIEAVHRLDGAGGVFTHVATGATRGGLPAEWRVIDVVALKGDLFARCELFDEDDLDAALVRFDELQRKSTALVNTATRVCERFRAAYAERDWDALAAMLADGLYNEDRRSVVNAGIRNGREPAMQDLREAAETNVPHFAATEIAIRGERLVLVRGATPYENDPAAFRIDSLQLAEIDAARRISAIVMFDVDDFDSALTELDARFMAGEGAPYAHVWSRVVQTYAAFNRQGSPKTTPDGGNIDRRPGGGSAPGQMTPNVSAIDCIVAVHRLSHVGAVFAHTKAGTAAGGWGAEHCEITLLTFDGDTIKNCEMFDQSDLDAALARFDELGSVPTHLTNAATRMNVRLAEVFNDRDLTGYLAACSSDARFDDRRKGIQYECPIDAEFGRALMSSAAESWRLRIETLAVRGHDLALSRYTFRESAAVGDSVAVEALLVIEIDADQLVKLAVVFDSDDLDGAFAELDARFMAGKQRRMRERGPRS